MQFNVKKKKDMPLAKTTVNLAEFAGLGGAATTKYHTLKGTAKKGSPGGGGGPFVLTVTYVCEGAGDDAEGGSETDQVDGSDDIEPGEEDPFAAGEKAPEPAPAAPAAPKEASAAQEPHTTPPAHQQGDDGAAGEKKESRGHRHKHSTSHQSRSKREKSEPAPASVAPATTVPAVAAAATTVPTGTLSASEEIEELRKERDELRKTLEILSAYSSERLSASLLRSLALLIYRQEEEEGSWRRKEGRAARSNCSAAQNRDRQPSR